MNTIQKLLACLLLGLLSFSYACSNNNDDDPVGCNWENEVETELNAVNDALMAYSTNPTTENCQAYNEALTDFINALEDHAECATIAGFGNELQAAIDAYQAVVDSNPC